MSNILKKRIMTSVYTIYVLRKMFSNTALKVYAGVALLYGIKVFVHVAAVINNMSDINNLSGLYNFLLNAIVNTDIAVQFIVFGILALVVWITVDTMKNIFTRGIQSQMQGIH